MYEAYADANYYMNSFKGNSIPEEHIPDALRLASRHVDMVTFNRIHSIGFDALTSFQRDIIREVVCRQAEFEYENEDEIGTVLQNYSINGVSAQFGSSWNVKTQDGVAMRRDIYSLLAQTGLCCRLVR